MILDPRQIVTPSSHIRYTNEYLSANRVYLLHVIDSDTERCYCSRDANGWDMPYRDEGRQVVPTIQQILNDDSYFCKRCIGSLKRRITENNCDLDATSCEYYGDGCECCDGH